MPPPPRTHAPCGIDEQGIHGVDTRDHGPGHLVQRLAAKLAHAPLRGDQVGLEAIRHLAHLQEGGRAGAGGGDLRPDQRAGEAGRGGDS